MITEKQLKRLLLILVGLVLFMAFFMVKCGSDPTPKPGAEIPTVKEIKADLKADTMKFIKKNDSLQKRIAVLEAAVVKYKGDHRADQRLVKELLNQAPVYLTGNEDSSKLSALVDELSAAIHASDSSCNATISAQDSVIMVKTEQYAAAMELNAEIRKSVDNLLAVSDAKDQQIKYWKKQTQKQKRGQAVLKVIAGAAILYGVKQSL